jgi:ribose 5-phosphate isomerase A
LDLAIDGADEVDSNLNCIKGGGACLFQEKLVAISAKKFILVAGLLPPSPTVLLSPKKHLLTVLVDYRKHSKSLGHNWTQGVPIEIVPIAHAKVLNDLVRMGARSPALRMGGKAKAGPIITDNGNFLIDANYGEIADPAGLAAEIKKLVGVVEVGLFVGMAEAAYFGNDGTNGLC